jgi:nicotinamide riboside transporter PnuC
MAEEPIGLKVSEKFFGLLIILVGAIIFYVTYTNIESLRPHAHPVIFLAVGVALIALGILMVLARAE